MTTQRLGDPLSRLRERLLQEERSRGTTTSPQQQFLDNRRLIDPGALLNERLNVLRQAQQAGIDPGSVRFGQQTAQPQPEQDTAIRRLRQRLGDTPTPGPIVTPEIRTDSPGLLNPFGALGEGAGAVGQAVGQGVATAFAPFEAVGEAGAPFLVEEVVGGGPFNLARALYSRLGLNIEDAPEILPRDPVSEQIALDVISGRMSAPQAQDLLVERFSKRPLVQQLLIGAIADPFNLSLVGKAARGSQPILQGLESVGRVMPESGLARVTSAVLPPSSLQQRVLNIRPVQTGLTRSEHLLNQVKQWNHKIQDFFPLDTDLGARLGDHHREIIRSADSEGVRMGRSHGYRINQAFNLNEQGRIEELAGVVEDVRGAPHYTTVAAKLPLYREHLTDAQIRALTDAANDVSRYRELLEEIGVEGIGTRRDIIDGGLYLPRGSAIRRGLDESSEIDIFFRSGGRPGALRPTRFDNAEDAIAEGLDFAPPGAVLEQFARQVGRHVADHRVANLAKSAIDPDTGLPIASSPAIRLPDELRQQVNKLRNQIRSRNRTIQSQTTRLSTLRQQGARVTRAAEGAAQRVESAEARADDLGDLFSRASLGEARKDLRTAIRDAQHLTGRIQDNVRLLKQTKKGLSKADREVQRKADELSAQLDTWSELANIDNPSAREVRRLHNAISRLDSQLESLSDEAWDMSSRVQSFVDEGQVLRDMRKQAREGISDALNRERTLVHNEARLRALRRELRALEREERRLSRLAAGVTDQAERESLKLSETSQAVDRLQRELFELSQRWNHEKQLAAQTPRGFSPVDFTQLTGHSFPDVVAASINKELGQHSRSDVGKFIHEINSIYRSLRATGDLSYMGIQGATASIQNPRAYGRALKAMLQAFARDDEQILGKFFNDFNADAAEKGLATLDQWTRADLPLTGTMSEFTSGTIMELPGFKQANRAFGVAGDIQRATWAQAELRRQKAITGKTIEQMLEDGTMSEIANAVSRATGWSPRTKQNDVMDLLFFAPRFLSSRIQTVMGAAQGFGPNARLQNRIQRDTLLKYILGTGSMTFIVNELLGNETDVQPIITLPNGERIKNPNFMRIRAAGRDWSLFGTWDSLFGALVSVSQGRPDDIFRSMGSGAVQLAWDYIISGEDFLGRPIINTPSEIAEQPGEFLGQVLSQLLPFAAEEAGPAFKKAQEALVTRNPGMGLEAALTLGGEFAGMKSYELSPSEKVSEARRQAARNLGLSEDFDTLGPSERDVVDSQPDVVRAKREQEENRRERNDAYQGFRDEERRIDSEAREKLIVNETLLPNPRPEFNEGKPPEEQEAVGLASFRRADGGMYDGGVYRNVHDTIKANVAAEKQRNREANPDVVKFLERLEPRNTTVDLIVQDYFNTLFDPEGAPLEDPVTGEFRWGLWDRRMQAWRNNWDDHQAEIEDALQQIHSNETPAEKQLRQDREYLESYWKIGENTADHFSLSNQYRQYLEAPQDRRTEVKNDLDKRITAEIEKCRTGSKDCREPFKGLRESLFLSPSDPNYNRPFSQLLAIIEVRKQSLRESDPKTDRKLYRWRYTTEGVNPTVIREIKQAQLQTRRESAPLPTETGTATQRTVNEFLKGEFERIAEVGAR